MVSRSLSTPITAPRPGQELGYWWAEEPMQHYHVRTIGEVARRLDITVSAGEQTYTLSGPADLIEAGVRMMQPDIVKWAAVPASCIALHWRRHTGSNCRTRRSQRS